MANRSLFIPKLGTRLLLSQPWEFTLYHEARNKSFLNALGYIAQRYYTEDHLIQENCHNPRIEIGEWTRTEKHIPGIGVGRTIVEVKKRMRLPAGTVLTIDRIYIRKGNEEYDSVSFNLNYCPDENFCPKSGFKVMGGAKATIPLIKGNTDRVRFWAKLDDVNTSFVFDDSFKGDFLP